MKQQLHYTLFSVILFLSCSVFGQDISLYQQFNGRYDFVFFGNTLNTIENNNINGLPAPPCTILTSSSADLSLNSDDVIESAYLYWAGSGTGDFQVKLNGQDITPQRTFSIINSSGLPCFSAFSNITSLVLSAGNGTYTFSDLDLTSIIADYCPHGGNFGGWAIVVIYKNNVLPLNQLNIYDGMQAVPSAINITLNSLNVIDNQDAKIGFVAWEGDKNISVTESLRINGNLIGNPPLNPVNNAFNGTNSFTDSSTMYNMDLDVYNIQNNINIGDTSAQIQLTSGQDFVMINAIVTKLNSQLPDATIAINNVDLSCNSRQIVVDYTVSNFNSTNILPSGTPIAIYANGIFIQPTVTLTTIPIDGSENGQISILIPDSIPADFDLQFVVDDNGSGIGVVTELNENNNIDLMPISLWLSPIFNLMPNKEACNEGLGRGTFDFSDYEELVKVNLTDSVSFYATQEDAENEVNPIFNTNNYIAVTTPATIFIRIENEHCFSITSFLLTTKNCPPIVHNFVSANNDPYNDTFFVEGLRDIFLNFKTSIYNRWGALVWTGNNNTEDWNGFATKGILLDNHQIPAGTYYYVIELNDPDYQSPLVGYLYLTR
ncbi:gliding motility-associated C-terminal domain-containing protein [Flavobacterium sp.]|uniref:gliding motility-associated C-terminal domain-containing protein n=1 Tax=Flavobacterium sp. TaxID=239 RepID=UPI002B4AD0A2|nr:gliding motility-associated C-terminal domain-containing protein [Flavobacterium sp.]HLF52086.1 gliding motility-associated C-terminal domain-containing protein [Flavobacterium sp.]